MDILDDNDFEQNKRVWRCFTTILKCVLWYSKMFQLCKINIQKYISWFFWLQETASDFKIFARYLLIGNELHNCTLILNSTFTFLEAITHSLWPGSLVSSFVPQHDRALVFYNTIFPVSLCPAPPSLLYLIKLTWIIFWSRFYKCLMNWLHDTNSVNLVSLNVRFSSAPLTGTNESADAAEE